MIYINNIFQTTYSGFTGNVQFDDDGKRKDFILHYSKLNQNSHFEHVGTWDSKTNIFTTKNDVADRSSADSGVIKVT